MNATEKALSEMDPDTRAVIEHAMTGKPLDPEAARRIHERAERATEEIYQKHGLLDIGVPAIRELRGELPDDNDDMNEVAPIPTETDPDMEAIIEHLITSRPLDPELVRRVSECSERATQELFEKHGFLNVAVDLIRECRDE
jgi:hypothetical protein